MPKMKVIKVFKVWRINSSEVKIVALHNIFNIMDIEYTVGVLDYSANMAI